MRDCRNVSARRDEYRVEPQNDAVVVVNRRVVKIDAIVRMERVRRCMPVANQLVMAIGRRRFMNMLRRARTARPQWPRQAGPKQRGKVSPE